MEIWMSASVRPLLRFGRRGYLAAALVALIAGAVLGVSCGGDKPAQEFFSRSEEAIQELVPEAHAFRLRVAPADGQSARHVDLTVSTDLEGEPRMHVISDADAVAGAELVEEYEGFSVYRQKASLWAELAPEPAPLYAGTASDDGLKAYVDFYRSGEPKLSDEQFWNGFAYARERMSEALQEEPALLLLDFDGEWEAEAGGLRIEALTADHRVYVAVLFAAEGTQVDAQGFDEELVSAFKQRFAISAEAEEQPENSDWGYSNQIWYADTAAAAGEE